MTTPEAVAQFLGRRRHHLVAEASETLAREIAAYGAFPREVLDGDIADVIRHNVEIFLDTLRTGRPADPVTLDRIRTSAARRAEERVPLDMMVSAYPLAARVIVQRLLDGLGGPDGPEDSLPAGVVVGLLDFLRVVVAAAVAGYLDEYELIQSATETDEQRLLDALVSGSTAALPDHPSVADSYRVLALAIGEHPDEHTSGVNAAMAARRKLRRVRDTFARLAGERQLASLTPTGGLVLLPEPVSDDWLDAVAHAAGATVVAGHATAARHQVADAARLARELLDLALLLGRGHGEYRIEDLSFEYQATRPGPGRDALAAGLQPLADHPELRATLRSYLAAGGNRRRAARAAGTHPNTVDNRLRRITALTGLDPTDPAVAAHLRTALLAHDATTRGAVPGGEEPNGPEMTTTP